MGKAVTKWGDRDGRRQDILKAARDILHKYGPTELNVREVAKRAGVSPGTLYIYFQTKEEIFLTVYAARIDELAKESETICAESRDFEDLYRKFAGAYLRFYTEYGRHLNLWTVFTDKNAFEDLPKELVINLRAQVMGIFTRVVNRIQEIAKRRSIRVNSGPLAIRTLWISLSGLAENYSGLRSKAYPYDWDEMTGFMAKTLIKGLTE